jgi:hypothetical protein
METALLARSPSAPKTGESTSQFSSPDPLPFEAGTLAEKPSPVATDAGQEPSRRFQNTLANENGQIREHHPDSGARPAADAGPPANQLSGVLFLLEESQRLQFCGGVR